MANQTEVIFKASKWETEDSSSDGLSIYIHGLTEDNQKVAVKVSNFTPYIYLELPLSIDWDNKDNRDLFDNHFRRQLKGFNYVDRKYIKSKIKAYFYRPAKFFRLHFNSIEALDHFCKIVSIRKKVELEEGDSPELNDAGDIIDEFKLKPRPITIPSIGKDLSFAVHEIKAARSPEIQLITATQTTPSGWISVPYDPIREANHHEKFSTCALEINVENHLLIKHVASNKTVDPIVWSYDIECTSGDASGNTFTKAKNDKDEVICISITTARLSEPESSWVKYCLVNAAGGKKCPMNIGDGSTIVNFRNERALLLGYRDLQNKMDPDVIVSYNGLSFDDSYLIKRSKKCGCHEEFMQIGRLLGRRAKVGKASWSSSAYKNQKFKFVNVPGRLHLDMFPFISKEFTTLPGYRLDDVSEYFLEDKKVDLPAKEMIQLHHRGLPEDIEKIAYYCNKDTVLPFKLLKHLSAFIGLAETSNVVKVQMFDLLIKGQQIRVYHQAYYFCTPRNIVINAQWSDYDPPRREKKFAGATVQNPKTGLHERIATFDFASLYPTTIIAFNLCFSTYIPDDEPDPPADQMHLLEWEDHYGCEHDHGVRKSKVDKKKIICSVAPGMKAHRYRFWKKEVKQGIIPQILVNLLDARKATKEEIKELEQMIEKGLIAPEDLDQKKMLLKVLDKRQTGFKISANSMYGGLGSDFSQTPFYPAAASTTYKGRTNIQKAIDVAKAFRADTNVVYGDTDSCMLGFDKVETIEEMFDVSTQLKNEFKKHFPFPMDLTLEKIYSVYFLLSKKRYIGRIVNREGKLLSVDKKGVIAKRRDNFSLVRNVFDELSNMIMDYQKKWKVYDTLATRVDTLLSGGMDYKNFVVTMSLNSDYKNQNLSHVVVSKKMISRGKYVTPGTRIQFLFLDTGDRKAKMYQKAEDPDYYLDHMDTLRIDYMTYMKKFVKPIDEILEVRFGVKDVVKNLHSLMDKKRIKNARDYFSPRFKVKDSIEKNALVI
jgi:DNA polymerase delta subunit 1